MKLINKPKKSLGQNFLIDKNIINKIIKVIDIDQNKTFLEIGPGYGNLTTEIKNLKPKKIYAVEKDKILSEYLKNIFKHSKNIEIINDDILSILNRKNFERNITVFGNLPYNISTKILTTLILLKKWPPWYENLIFMFQKEVADRILATKNTKDFGRLAILCKWRMNITKHFNISKNCFFPKPAVDSTMLSFKLKKNNKFIIYDPKNLEKVTRVLFSNRRKMLRKNFLILFKGNTSIADKLNINLNQRPGELSEETFYKITATYEKLLN